MQLGSASEVAISPGELGGNRGQDYFCSGLADASAAVVLKLISPVHSGPM